MREKIVAQLYEGILEPNEWYSGLNELRRCTDSALFHHAVWSRRDQLITKSVSNDALPSDKLREFDLYHAPSDPRIPLIMQARQGRLMLDHEHFTVQEMSRSPIYAQWLASLRYRHTLGLVLSDNGNEVELLALIRPMDHSSFDGGRESLIRQILPDLLRAARLRSRSVEVAAQVQLGMAALNVLPYPVALVDDDLRLEYANPQAENIFIGHSNWRVRNGRVHVDDADLQQRLQAAVAAACQRKERTLGREVGNDKVVPFASCLVLYGVKAYARLNILPLPANHPIACFHSQKPHAMLVWAHVKEAGFLPDTSMLVQMLGITDTQARLAVALTQGLSLKEFAKEQGCTWHTARTHLRNLMAKTGLKSQHELATMVRQLALGIHA